LRPRLFLMILSLGLGALPVCACTTTSIFVDNGASAAAEAAVARLIASAVTSIDLVVASFPPGPLSEAVRLATLRGVEVRVLLAESSDTTWLTSQEIPALPVPTTVYRALVIDQKYVVLGSLDFLVQQTPLVSYDVVFVDCSGSTGRDSVAGSYARILSSLWDAAAAQEIRNGVSREERDAIILYDVNPAGECLAILNVSTIPIDLAGWSISDLEGRYVFPSPSWVQPNDPLSLCIATYNPTYDPGGVYLDDEHDEVYLADPEGDIVAEWVW
jgi:hypothetical protein